MIPSNKTVLLKIDYKELHLGRFVKASGAKWNDEKHAWELMYSQVRMLGLDHRMIHEIPTNRKMAKNNKSKIKSYI